MNEEINMNIKDDGLDEIIKRINKAVNYKGNEDHEDVRSIIKELLKQNTLAILQSEYDRLDDCEIKDS